VAKPHPKAPSPIERGRGNCFEEGKVMIPALVFDMLAIEMANGKRAGPRSLTT